jgi:hypothetical protein
VIDSIEPWLALPLAAVLWLIWITVEVSDR